ncbi:cysteine desulfurase family protein [Liquorilactobacillus uvarum]|uniref:cysteine desulfurase family protein n=1 Tax=Liquorilactobacillus uvarum TaxID=303240 RepID=UPI00288AF64C|nr:cysteine desulfurase family protein [Liquorilactobacillus uvarum]
MIYFDNAATTKMSVSALKAYKEVAENFYGNSESLHFFGNQSNLLVDESRQTIAKLLNVIPDGLIFTSGGTESNQVGLSALARIRDGKNEILVSPLEHSSIYQILDRLKDEKQAQVRILPVDRKGKITPTILENNVSAKTALIVIQAVNSITGIVQDISALKKIAAKNDIPLFVDAVQAATKVPLDFSGITGFSCSGHKFNGPKGSGLLFISPNALTVPQYNNVFQQNGFLPGTLDVPGIVSMTTAFQEAYPKTKTNYALLKKLQESLERNISTKIQVLHGTYPGICGLILPHVQAQEAVTRMGQLGFCFSTVSACSIKDPRPNRSLLSLGLTEEETTRYIRISFSSVNTIAEIRLFTDKLNKLYG